MTADEPSTEMRFQEDPDGLRGLSGRWHGVCAQPYWDTITPVLRMLRGG